MDALVALWNVKSSVREKIPCEQCSSVLLGPLGRLGLTKSLQWMWSDVEKYKQGILI